MDAIATIYLGRGHVSKSAPLFERALEIRRELYPQGHPDLADSLRSLGILRFAQGYSQESGDRLREAVAMRKRFVDDDHLELALDKFFLAWAMMEVVGGRGTVSMFEEVLVTRRKHLPPDDPQIAYAITGLALSYLNSNRTNEAVGLISEAAGSFDDADVNPIEPLVPATVGFAYLESGLLVEALAQLQSVVDLTSKIYGRHHPISIYLKYYLSTTINIRLITHRQSGLDASALQSFSDRMLRESVTEAMEFTGNHPRTAMYAFALGSRLERENPTEALSLFQTAASIICQCESVDASDALRVHRCAAKLYAAGQWTESEKAYRHAARFYQGDDDLPDSFSDRSTLARSSLVLWLDCTSHVASCLAHNQEHDAALRKLLSATNLYKTLLQESTNEAGRRGFKANNLAAAGTRVLRGVLSVRRFRFGSTVFERRAGDSPSEWARAPQKP